MGKKNGGDKPKPLFIKSLVCALVHFQLKEIPSPGSSLQVAHSLCDISQVTKYGSTVKYIPCGQTTGNNFSSDSLHIHKAILSPVTPCITKTLFSVSCVGKYW